MEISSILSSINIIITFSVIIGIIYLFLLVGLYYFSSGKTIIPFYWPFKSLADILARWYIVASILLQIVFLFGLWMSAVRIELKILITALYAISTAWLFWITYKKYTLRKSKIESTNQKECK